MTEAEWYVCDDPTQMLNYLSQSVKGLKTSELKTEAGRRLLRLFLCASVRRVWHLLDNEVSRKAVETAERFADGEVGRSEMDIVWSESSDYGTSLDGAQREISPRRSAAMAACWTAFSDLPPVLHTWSFVARHEQGLGLHWQSPVPLGAFAVPYCELLRDLFGNPFRPVACDPAWRTPQVVALATAVYQERMLPSGGLDRESLLVLSDAVEEAGCADAEALGHLRADGTHIRGCWVLDALLDKRLSSL